MLSSAWQSCLYGLKRVQISHPEKKDMHVSNTQAAFCCLACHFITLMHISAVAQCDQVLCALAVG